MLLRFVSWFNWGGFFGWDLGHTTDAYLWLVSWFLVFFGFSGFLCGYPLTLGFRFGFGGRFGGLDLWLFLGFWSLGHLFGGFDDYCGAGAFLFHATVSLLAYFCYSLESVWIG